jgi:hypothetical protein
MKHSVAKIFRENRTPFKSILTPAKVHETPGKHPYENPEK